ncbi:MAG: ABC transporter ATP-binding protein [Lapillicoccus sp.]
MSPAIEVHDLHKSFGSSVALDGLDLEVAAGEVHALIGPNGSGKSTTIRILLGLMRADSGSVTLLGGDPWADVESLHRRLAYVPGDVTLWPNLSGGEVIDLLGRLRGGLNADKRADLVERFELDPTRKGRTYSKGNRQKVALVAALSSDVDLLVLDEPTSGLDPLMEGVFRQAIEAVRAEGRTVLLSSHILSEVEALADRLSIIRSGRTVETGSLADLRHLTRTTVDAVLTNPPVLQDISVLTGVANARLDGDRLTCSVETTHLGDLLARLGQHGIRSLTSQPPSLEELFMDQYRRPTPHPEDVRA